MKQVIHVLVSDKFAIPYKQYAINSGHLRIGPVIHRPKALAPAGEHGRSVNDFDELLGVLFAIVTSEFRTRLRPGTSVLSWGSSHVSLVENEYPKSCQLYAHYA